MPALSQDQLAQARKTEALILKHLASVGQRNVADTIGVDESTISRLKEGHFERIAHILAVLGLKVVPSEMKCFDPATVGMLLELSRARLNSIERADELAWD